MERFHRHQPTFRLPSQGGDQVVPAGVDTGSDESHCTDDRRHEIETRIERPTVRSTAAQDTRHQRGHDGERHHDRRDVANASRRSPVTRQTDHRTGDGQTAEDRAQQPAVTHADLAPTSGEPRAGHSAHGPLHEKGRCVEFDHTFTLRNRRATHVLDSRAAPRLRRLGA